MRINLLIFFFVFLIKGVLAQSRDIAVYKIDSIKQNVLQSKVADSIKIAHAHYNIGALYRNLLLIDSSYHHYHKAEKLFKSLGNKYQLALTLHKIANIQTNEKDYTGSEVTSTEAINLLEGLKASDEVLSHKAYLYNNLGIVFNELEQFSESINYHKKALEIKKKLSGDNTFTINNSMNNLGYVYKNSSQYKIALEYYDKILANKNLINERPSFYTVVLDNYAHTLFLSGNYGKLPGLYLKTLKICDSLNNVSSNYNKISINLNLAEYYHEIHKKDSAKYYAYKAKEISQQYYNDDLLRSLMLLSEIEEGAMAAKHLKNYVNLSDSLQKAERRVRNKFARIRFETDKIEQEKEQIAKERMWLLIISVVVIMASFLLYLVITQRNKNKELQFIQKQQEANEEIYNLMLSQNESVEEARTLEKKRISEELHDGVLGRLFGTRLSLDSLNFNNTPEAIKTRSQYIEELKNIEQDIRKVSHELNTDFVSGAGFIDIIKTLVETQSIAYKLEYNLEHDDSINWDEVTNKRKIHIYRIIQETLHNIYKHANARKVDISFKLKNNVICLTIVDNGSGFDVNKAKSGIGLKNMNSRINEIGGKLNITSKKEIGTTVIIEVPLL